MSAMPFVERRKRILDECCFTCRCALCMEQEREWSRAGREAAKRRIAERKAAAAAAAMAQAQLETLEHKTEEQASVDAAVGTARPLDAGNGGNSHDEH